MEKRKLQDDDSDTEPNIKKKKERFSYDSDSDDSSENETNHQSLTSNKHEQTFLNTLANKTSNGQKSTIESLPIQTELVEKWSEIMSNGLDEQVKLDFIEKYPIPPNFNNLRGPIINPELAVHIKEKAWRRDYYMRTRQNLIGNMLACIGRTLTGIHNGEIDKEKISEQLNDAATLAAQIHHIESMNRRKFVQQQLGKSVFEKIKDLKPDETLFGKEVSTILKGNASTMAPLPSTSVNKTIKNQIPAPKYPQKLNKKVWTPNLPQKFNQTARTPYVPQKFNQTQGNWRAQQHNQMVRTPYVPQKFNQTQENFRPQQQFRPVKPWSRIPWLTKESKNTSTTTSATNKKTETPEETHFPPSWI